MTETETSLKDQRLAAGLTRQQLAAEAKCSIAFIQMIEGGFRPVQSATLPRIVAVLNDHAAAASDRVEKGAAHAHHGRT